MNSNTHGYLTDDHGHPSSMRLMSMVALMAAIAFGLITLLHEEANGINGVYLTVSFLLAAFAPKALQKFAEAKFPSSGPSGGGAGSSGGSAGPSGGGAGAGVAQ